ncbi:ABC transporter ATP-binding protein [Pokkaliibacter sp. MBI-7]|uniref:ABC transporter ATP-binding protein n=1 Tax=Pokkaliibacter sp. MBI-7 TaxID=3040600 RepID=UPI00244697C3|nr:ABC transporter ATP-binding protein [Pokkaliibacter sp. MBI-7]MDH2435694.1 ABC transporter ATP-binding protein [Pokkaliibacter sp. MBI-7]
MLEIFRLGLTQGKQVLAQELDLKLGAGQINVIVGPNGTGKSSLLRALFGELRPDRGRIVLDGDELSSMPLALWRRRFGYMPQDSRLDVSLSVLEVVVLGRLDHLRLAVDEHSLQQALLALENVGLLHLADRDVATLSGGQRQMVLFAQVLLRQPRVLMLDEPVSALDLHYQHVLLERLREQTRARSWITLMVLHDLNLAAQYADQLIVLYQGGLAGAGAPEKIMTQQLIETVYRVKAEVSHDHQGCPFVRTLRHAWPEETGCSTKVIPLRTQRYDGQG